MSRRPTASRRRAVLGVVGAGLALLVATRSTWVHGRTWTALAEVDVRVAGTRAAPLVAAAALLLLAAALALAVARRRAGVVAALVVVVGAVLAGAAAVAVLLDPSAAAAAGAARDVGVDGLVSDVAVTAGPWVALVISALAAAGGVVAALSAPAWTTGTRHEAPAASAPRDDWEALTLGDDPTDDDGASGAAARA